MRQKCSHYFKAESASNHHKFFQSTQYHMVVSMVVRPKTCEAKGLELMVEFSVGHGSMWWFSGWLPKVLLCAHRYEAVVNRASVPVHRRGVAGTEHGTGIGRRSAGLLFGVQRVLACVQYI